MPEPMTDATGCWAAGCPNPATTAVGMCESHHAGLLLGQILHDGWHESISRWERCAGCGQLFRMGDTIRVDHDEDDPQYFHDRCEPI